MLAMKLAGPGRAITVDLPRPSVSAPGDAVLMVTTAAIGPWDIAAYEEGVTGMTPGAQFAGIVVETGAGVKSVSLDDLVACRIAPTSGHSPALFGRDLPGGHAEYVRVPDADRMLVKTTPAAEERTVLAGGAAALGIVAAEKVLALPDAQLVMAWGCDAAALTALAWLKRRSGGTVRTVAFDPSPTRSTAAKQHGAERLSADDLAGVHPDVVLVGQPARGPRLEELAQCLRAGATLIFTDPAAAGAHGMTLPAGVEAMVCEWPSLEQTRRAALAIQLKQIDLTSAVSHVMPLDQAADAYRQALESPRGTQTILLKP
jgi:alcohol dehydrogenase